MSARQEGALDDLFGMTERHWERLRLMRDGHTVRVRLEREDPVVRWLDDRGLVVAVAYRKTATDYRDTYAA